MCYQPQQPPKPTKNQLVGLLLFIFLTTLIFCWIWTTPLLAQCSGLCGDCNGDGAVTIEEIIQVINNSLAGEQPFPPTPTPTPSFVHELNHNIFPIVRE